LGASPQETSCSTVGIHLNNSIYHTIDPFTTVIKSA
jgi:hypothetical protein